MGCTTSLSEKPEQYDDQPAVRYGSIADVQNGLTAAGLDSANLVLGVDFPSADGNPTYLNVVKVIGEVFESFIDQEYPIHAFGLGVDRRLGKSLCFPFAGSGALPDMGAVLSKYQALAESVRSLQGGSWAPLVRRAIEVVRKTGRYHVLLILSSDPRSTDRDTQQAIEEASRFPMAIVMIGVGAGPWDSVQEFADRGMARSNSMAAMIQTDGFQFVAFDEVAGRFEGEATTSSRSRRCSRLPPIEQTAGGSRRQVTVNHPATDCDKVDWKQLGKQEAARLSSSSSCSAARFAWEALNGLPMHYKAIEQSGIKRTISGWSIGQGVTVTGTFPDPQSFEENKSSEIRVLNRSATWPITSQGDVEEQQWAACAHAVPPRSALEAQRMRPAYGDVAVGYSRSHSLKGIQSKPEVAASRKKSTLGRMTTLSWQVPTSDSGFTGYIPRAQRLRSNLIETGVSTGIRRSSLVARDGVQMAKWSSTAAH